MTKTYRVLGMTCGGCARAVTNAIKTAAPEAPVLNTPAPLRRVIGEQKPSGGQPFPVANMTATSAARSRALALLRLS